jgi:hypothetical protein
VAAEDAADAAYRRLEAGSDTLEYQIDWDVARRRAAAAAANMTRAERALVDAGGYADDDAKGHRPCA